MRVLVLKPYPHDSAASQRFRFEQYEEFLAKNNITFIQVPFLNHNTWERLYLPGNFMVKLTGILRGFLHRFHILRMARKSQMVFIHREASPLGPPVFEWIIAKLFKKKIIYDFDDAIWLTNTSGVNRLIAGIKWHSKVRNICKWSYKISCGNEFLAQYARRFNNKVKIIPTTIDTVHYHNKIKDQSSKDLIIGWTGSHSTLPYLEPLIPILKSLNKEFDFKFCVIADQPPDQGHDFIKFIPWRKDREIGALLNFNIGIMPLPDNSWGKGKCGFKILQYLALGIPAVADAVGTNKKIIAHNKNGFLCHNTEEWHHYLALLLKNQERRKKLGRAGRQTVMDHYSIKANQTRYLELFK